jgi:quinoprotein glucose dehydrogenase
MSNIFSIVRRNIDRPHHLMWIPATLAFGVAVSCPIEAVGQEKPKPEVPVLSPASPEATTAIGSFKKPEGWSCELFAAEPMVGNPVAFTIDGRGRVMVCESYRQNKGVTDNRGHDQKWLAADLAAMTVADRIRYHRELLGTKAIEYETHDDLLRLLVDSDGDGKADKSSVFASGFNAIEEGTGSGALVRGNKVYYTNIPKLWALVDQNDDGVADDRVILSDGFGVRVAFRGHDMHGLILGHDGRLYFSIGDRGYHVETPNGVLADPESGAVFRCELDGSRLEVFATGLRNPQELAFDDFGNLFTGDNNSDSGDKARWVYVVRGSDSGWRMMYQYISDRGPFNREKIWHPFSPSTPAYIVPPIANVGDGPSGLVCYPGTGIGTNAAQSDLYRNAFFLCDFRGQSSNSGIRMIKVKPKGAFFELETNQEFIWSILATDIDFAPDGSIFISDWVNGWNGENKGRIYRFADPDYPPSEEAKKTASLLATGMTGRSLEELGRLLAHADRRVRLEAQWELSGRGDRSIFIEALKQKGAPVLKRLHAVWGLGQILRATPIDKSVSEALLGCLSDGEPMLVARATEMLAEAGLSTTAPTIAKNLKHESAVVQAATCLALGQLGYSDALADVAGVIAACNDSDPVLRHAGIMAIAGVRDNEKLLKLKSHSSDSVRLAAVVALRKNANPIISQFLSDSSPRVVLEAVRAIHDVPRLHTELANLAAIQVGSETDDAVVARVLNANFRLGLPQNAMRLAFFAARSNCKDSHRIEALEMLSTWANPGDRDRVMNRHLPLTNREASVAEQALKDRIEELSAANDQVRDKFIEVGAKFGMTEIGKLVLATAQDTNADGQRRAAAIRALASLDPNTLRPLIAGWLNDSNADVRIASLAIAVRDNPESAVALIRNATESKTIRERQNAWDLLRSLSSAAAKDQLAVGVRALLEGSLPKDCWLNVIEAADGKLDSDLQTKLTQRISALELKKDSEPKAYYQDCLEGGDADRGRSLFFTRSSLSCVRCHKVGQTGGEVGPVLNSLGIQKTREYLLEAIVAPNLAIAQGFETAVIADDDGNTHTGIVKSEDDLHVTLMDAQGNLIKIAKESIEARRKGSSSMPVDLMKYLNKRELRDLVAYLASLDGSPQALVGPDDFVGGHKQ